MPSTEAGPSIAELEVGRHGWSDVLVGVGERPVRRQDVEAVVRLAQHAGVADRGHDVIIPQWVFGTGQRPSWQGGSIAAHQKPDATELGLRDRAIHVGERFAKTGNIDVRRLGGPTAGRTPPVCGNGRARRRSRLRGSEHVSRRPIRGFDSEPAYTPLVGDLTAVERELWHKAVEAIDND